MKEIKCCEGHGALLLVKELGTELLAALLFTLGLPDPVRAAREILTQGNLRLFLSLTLNKTTFVPATSLKTTGHVEGSHVHEADVANTVSFASSHLCPDDGVVPCMSFRVVKRDDLPGRCLPALPLGSYQWLTALFSENPSRISNVATAPFGFE